MSEVTRAAGVAGTFLYTLDRVPVEAPLYTLFSDAALSVVAQIETRAVATARADQFECSYSAALARGTYYIQFRNRFTVGQPYVTDTNDQLVLVDPAGVVGGSTPPIERIRQLTDAGTDFSDAELQNVLDRYTNALTGVVDYQLAARDVWAFKAARYSKMMDVTESGSSRKMSDLHKNAIAMMNLYSPKDGDTNAPGIDPEPPVRTRIRSIERA